MPNSQPIGVFDSGFGGLTILKEIIKVMPEYDFLFLGDNARAPYGTRSFDIVYEYTRQCAKYLMDHNCPLVILACNTASAKALRTIQQKDLPMWEPQNRVLGIIRPTVENILQRTKTKHIGFMIIALQIIPLVTVGSIAVNNRIKIHVNSPYDANFA